MSNIMSSDKLKILFIGLITGIVNGLFGSGGGTIVVPALVFLLHIEDHKSHATAISIILPLTIISTFIYFRNGIIDFKVALIIASGGIIGGYIGAKLLNKVPRSMLRKIFGLFMIIAGLRMVF
ncbi:putative permease [Gottschalkia acidurici 9a]|uniref:Probable membrane transporter protein n=1 Tax=Gottschalkia acidurici (strain ATCC 7906 / DSM 604 / BCRC 14475 / CIP 104303 / KCTC 5404 / NCIMB 10678 / 9a) TaxID=1128398 RepID=K0B080_GOTA9|nr:sulfite exporter TauE/SafE family protein [Gottschalkia acidurici]AFS78056.1 putative permease [Gottschalkia acidurici 9a]